MNTPNSFRRTILYLFLIIVLLVFLFGAFLFWRNTANSDPVSYHLAKLEEATLALTPPRNAAEFFTWKHLRFSVGKALSRERYSLEDVETHRQKLLTLGYLQKTTFTLLSTNLVPHLYPTIMAAKLNDMNWSYYREDTNIIVTAATADLPQWHRIFSNLNSRPH